MMMNGVTSKYKENDDDDEEGDDDDWNEMEQDQEPTQCLFCSKISDSIELAIQHLESGHNIDLSSIKDRFNMDQYSYIKVWAACQSPLKRTREFIATLFSRFQMINYIRTHKVEPTIIANAKSQLWADDIYLKPVTIDAWLMFGK